VESVLSSQRTRQSCRTAVAPILLKADLPANSSRGDREANPRSKQQRRSPKLPPRKKKKIVSICHQHTASSRRARSDCSRELYPPDRQPSPRHCQAFQWRAHDHPANDPKCPDPHSQCDAERCQPRRCESAALSSPVSLSAVTGSHRQLVCLQYRRQECPLLRAGRDRSSGTSPPQVAPTAFATDSSLRRQRGEGRLVDLSCAEASF
jgi:hypothetical protein